MKIDGYLGIYGDDLKSTTNKLYDNMKCVWKLDDISSLTIIEFINYNLTKMLEKDINLKYLYQIAHIQQVNCYQLILKKKIWIV